MSGLQIKKHERDQNRITKPIVAAINGHAIGGGFELATLTDALRLETINAYSSLGDFSEARERLAQFYAKGKNTEEA